MKRRKIAKETALINSIIPETTRDALKAGEGMLAGGAMTGLFSGMRINDFDFFFRYESDAINASGITGHRKIDTDNAITHITDKGVVYQFVKIVTGSPEEVLDSFDFTLNQCAYDFRTQEFIYGDYFFQHLAAKRLVFTMSERANKFPLSTLYRMRKYLQRGFTIDGLDLIKIALLANDLKIENYTQLKEQLMGIDAYILRDVLSSLEYDKKDQPYQYKECIKWFDDHIDFFHEATIPEENLLDWIKGQV